MFYLRSNSYIHEAPTLTITSELILFQQIQTHADYYAALVNECEGKATLATEEIERDLHRWVLHVFLEGAVIFCF